MVNTGTQCGKQALTTNCSNHQRRPRRSLSDVGITGLLKTDSNILCSTGCETQRYDIMYLFSYITSALESASAGLVQNQSQLYEESDSSF